MKSDQCRTSYTRSSWPFSRLRSVRSGSPRLPSVLHCAGVLPMSFFSSLVPWIRSSTPSIFCFVLDNTTISSFSNSTMYRELFSGSNLTG